MTSWHAHWQAKLALLICAAAAASLAFGTVDADTGSAAKWGALGVCAAAALLSLPRMATALRAALLLAGSSIAAWILVGNVTNGTEGWAYFLALVAAWLLAWAAVSALSALKPAERTHAALLRLAIPVIFGAWILVVWEAVTRGAGIPFVLLPPPSAVWVKLVDSLPVLAADVNQTIFKSVVAGYIMGCASGFGVAILADRFDFLRRGLLPIGNVVSALPIIGVAPIMVMWFGFDWQSKAAVVVVMTFFPMLVNTVAGLTESGHIERDLMRTYAAGYWQTLFKLRLPAAAPFIFNALKINSTLALIGAIVAEFFGTPIVGMGFRISTEVGRMNIDMVWAEIAVAALIGSLFYGAVALCERAVTFWHPSVRSGWTG